MKKIASFTVDHSNLFPGIYVSRKDVKDGVTVTTFDLRMTAPNREPVMDTPGLHTIEHLGATFLRNSAKKDEIIYFGPMGCRTGFYLVVFGDKSSEDVYPLVMDMCHYILCFSGEIPGARPNECGNYLDQNLGIAKYYVQKFADEVEKYKRFEYRF